MWIEAHSLCHAFTLVAGVCWPALCEQVPGWAAPQNQQINTGCHSLCQRVLLTVVEKNKTAYTAWRSHVFPCSKELAEYLHVSTDFEPSDRFQHVPTFSSLRKVSADAALRVWAISPVRGDQSHPESHLFSNVANDSIRHLSFQKCIEMLQSISIYPISIQYLSNLKLCKWEPTAHFSHPFPKMR